MPRTKLRTTFLMPQFIHYLKMNFGTFTNARNQLKLVSIPEADFWRIARGKEATPAEVKSIQDACLQHAKNRKAPKELLAELQSR